MVLPWRPLPQPFLLMALECLIRLPARKRLFEKSPFPRTPIRKNFRIRLVGLIVEFSITHQHI